ncbi:MAG TPA: CcdB family protein [Steroidobacter sp.]|jgi:toxin CcdB|nr:CcdB family protein [Steroidobacteraceae bacterium]HLS82964.1 CcdB family protein [Steroidobacter sp.]
MSGMSRQFEVFENPIARARQAYPYVAILQSDVAETGSDRIVAPLARRADLSGTAGRLTPHVKVLGVEHVLVVPSMTAIAAADLRESRDDIASHRHDIVAALDFLFLGV